MVPAAAGAVAPVVPVWAAAAVAMKESARSQRFMNASGLGGDSGEQRLENSATVRGSDEIFHRALGMRHDSEHVSFRADDPGDVAHGAVRVGIATRNAVLVHVSKDDSP